MVFCFNRMNISVSNLILFSIMLLSLILIFGYFNNTRTSKIENFIDPIVVSCTPENYKMYTTQYITNSNMEFKDAYEKCTDHVSTVNLNMMSLNDELQYLMDSNIDLNDLNGSLTGTRNGLSNDLTNSNNHFYSLSNSNILLNENLVGLTDSNSNLNSVSNLLDSMDSYQNRINALSNLENTITGQICDEMNQGVNCGLNSIETLTKEKLQEVLQSHIDSIPDLSQAYILAVKMWIAYQKASLGSLIDSSDSNMVAAIGAYDETMETLNRAEKSMYTVIQLYSLYKDNFFHTTEGESNSMITLSNLPNNTNTNINIPFSNSFTYSNQVSDNSYNKLFETCSSSNTETETNSNIYNVEALCTSSNYSVIIETITASNCSTTDEREDCVREQDSNVRSGLEYIYRSEFTRESINNIVDNKNMVDQNIIITFLHNVFNKQHDAIVST